MVYAENFDLSQYGQSQLSAHDIYWVKRDGSRVLVRRAGEYLDQENLKRYPKLDFEIKIDHLKILPAKEILLKLKTGLRPKEKIKLANNVRDLWSEWFFSPTSLSPLEIMILGDEIMSDSYKELASEWSAPSTILFQRSCLIASLSLLGAISLGYTSWKFLEELWKINFTYSAHFSEKGMKLSDLNDLEKNRTGKDEQTYSFTLMKSQFVSIVQMTELIFEKSDGTGAPKNISYHELSDLERWFNYLHQSISWNKTLVDQDNQHWKNIWAEDPFDILSKLQSDSVDSMNHEYIEFEL
ncbi:MAG: hypothetical protein COW01_10195 [Bdellovibrionales bacterium CG12_big_fil_rev_8_21_14_0_65_38_15]|nr:MAG: hypothetical protein COW79_07040 [Bdellovibrionales bacterium CG22_combo_CG10-13_8_21_14_all_38_13]PIQ54506.1 MAG: hypothetical protein COW01_10195 [Bdellovibrionales bacterium CG12_big_fil_rev_8_21_14_0_65_38_15]PIR29887.1 MAG: hypothetical protein COV38_08040 [Bdellovibrionales bacterium CG11_big_fil_rev_8_21_14_0_20_38_13]